MAQNTLSNLRLPLQKESTPAEMRAGFDTVGGFELMQRGATLLANSSIVPSSYRVRVDKKDFYGNITTVENEAAIPNCVVALNMAQRLGADPLMIMQNLYIVEGRPAWSSQFIIASINACGKYSPLRFEIKDCGEITLEYEEVIGWEGRKPIKEKKSEKIIDKECVAWAVEKATGEKLTSPPITIGLAGKEGWYARNGSKWRTMPEVMLRYRAASFFGKLYAPELLMGISTAEEIQDNTYDLEIDQSSGGYQVNLDDIRKPESSEKEKTGVNLETREPATKTEATPAERNNEKNQKKDISGKAVKCPKTGELIAVVECNKKDCSDSCRAIF